MRRHSFSNVLYIKKCIVKGNFLKMSWEKIILDMTKNIWDCTLNSDFLSSQPEAVVSEVGWVSSLFMDSAASAWKVLETKQVKSLLLALLFLPSASHCSGQARSFSNSFWSGCLSSALSVEGWQGVQELDWRCSEPGASDSHV